MTLWTWHELSERVCGNPIVDLAILKKKAVYEGCEENSVTVKYLWQALADFSQEDRQLFVRFCWGRTRLPQSEDSPMWKDGFKIANASDIPQNGLPRGHTCFFQIDLPTYTDSRTCKERILYAVR